MSNSRKPELGFSHEHAVAIEVPVLATQYHRPHRGDFFVIELNDGEDTANFYLNETNIVSGSNTTTRKSVTVPLALLADLVRRRPMTATEKEDFARAERDEAQEFGDGEDEEDEGEGQRV